MLFVYSPRKTSNFYFDKGHNHKKIAMSYLNVVRTGCVEVDRKHQLNSLFINDCFMTMGLDGYLIEDDREEPRYPRYPSTLLKKAIDSGNTEKAEEIQTFIEQEWKHYLNTIYEKMGILKTWNRLTDSHSKRTGQITLYRQTETRQVTKSL